LLKQRAVREWIANHSHQFRNFKDGPTTGREKKAGTPESWKRHACGTVQGWNGEIYGMDKGMGWRTFLNVGLLTLVAEELLQLHLLGVRQRFDAVCRQLSVGIAKVE